MDLLPCSELNRLNSYRQAQQCLQDSVAKQRIDTQDDCHSKIRDENSPDFDFQEENVPEDSIDHNIQNSQGSSITSARSVCEEFVVGDDDHNVTNHNENLGPTSQDGESEYRVPAEIKSMVVAGSFEYD